jgi:Raf kinase inhibitor-like YbhB/YbcL family protein
MRFVGRRRHRAAGRREDEKMRMIVRLILAFALAGHAEARAVSVMRLTSPAIGADGRIPAALSSYGADRSPPLAWTPVAGARSYAIILDDPDASDPRPFVHWLIWNIPGSVATLPEGLPPSARLATPTGAVQGRNEHDGVGYWGPHPPSGVHHYHLRVFALDAPLWLAPGADRDALSAAMNGHLLGAGELIASFAAPGGR